MREEMRIKSRTARQSDRCIARTASTTFTLNSMALALAINDRCTRTIILEKSAENKEITANSGTPVTLLGFAPFNERG